MRRALRGLSFREVWLSPASVIILLVCLSAPVVLAYSFEAVPSSVGVLSERIISGWRLPPSALSPEVEHLTLNRTLILEDLRGYVDAVVVVQFALAGALTALVMARPLEYKYFFLEVLLRGGRLRAYAERYSMVLGASLLSSALTAMTAASVLYVSNAIRTLAGCYAYMLAPLILACLSAVSLSSLITLAVRRSSESLLLFFALTAVLLMLGLKYGGLASLVVTTRLAHGGRGAPVYALVVLLSNALCLWRVRRLEY